MPSLRRAPRVSYRRGDAVDWSAEPGVLAVFTFGAGAATTTDPRMLRVSLENLDASTTHEVWRVDGPVRCGRDDALQWAAGEGWLFAAIELDETDHGGPADTARLAYRRLTAFVATRTERHVLRLWNYLDAINQGEGDEERYKHFCAGRAEGMGDAFAEGFPAASAIGQASGGRRLQVYLLACEEPGQRVENPRQLSAWRYPRQYGRTPPSFARAMVLPAADALAISGTAAVVGHASAHADDLNAQLDETLRNLDSLLASGGMAPGFDANSPLKVYVRHRAHAAHVRAFLEQRLPGVPLLLLHGDICRSELLVEIDGWRYA